MCILATRAHLVTHQLLKCCVGKCVSIAVSVFCASAVLWWNGYTGAMHLLLRLLRFVSLFCIGPLSVPPFGFVLFVLIVVGSSHILVVNKLAVCHQTYA